MKTLSKILHNKTSLVGLTITLIFFSAIIIGPAISPYTATQYDFDKVLQAPSWAHFYGTDSFGRDTFTRVLYGGRVSMIISISGVFLAMLVGLTLGMLSGYKGGWFDAFFMRIVDLFFAFPAFVLALFLMVVLGFGVTNVALAIALVYMPIFARIARNTTSMVKNDAYVQAAKVMGQSTFRILFREIFPNISAPVMVQASVAVAFGVIIEAGLSFIGLGVQPPTASLGVIMADGQEYFRKAPWALTLCGLTITVALLGLNLLGDGLRDLSDPKLRVREQ